MSFGKFKDLKSDFEPSSGANKGDASEGAKMFDFVKNQRQQSLASTSQKVCFGQGSKILGQVYFEGMAEVYGEIEGEIVSKGSLLIGESACIKAKITGQEVAITGKVVGDIEVTKKLSLKRPAQVVGNIKAPVLSMEEGVIFQGGCKMERPVNNPVQTNNDEPKEKLQRENLR